MTGRRRQSPNDIELNPSNELGFLQEDDLGMSKICVICNEDCSNERRFQNEGGQYLHQRCYVHEHNPSGQPKPAPETVTNAHSLKLWEFVYCTVCDRPLKTYQCRAAVRERVADNGKRYQEIKLRCVQCGHKITELKKSDRFLPLLLLIFVGLGTTVELKNSFSGLSWSGVIIIYILPVCSGALAWWWLISNSRRDCKSILDRWSVKHGVDSSTWPKPIKHWVDLYGNNAGNWPPPSS